MNQKIAIAGVSSNPKRFGYTIFNDLRKKGFDICPVNPKAKDIDGVKFYASISDVPDEYKKLFIVTPKTATNEVLKEASKKGINHVWIQQTANTKESAVLAKANNIELIEKECIYMYTEPVAGMHKFHRTINKIFSLLAK